ncbi:MULTISPECIES: recombinase family protein [Asticcacaulis]|uniref:recombinase family protein n=1 Tax=Asticcacaulis TaxID=76890 RepID=UPI001AE88CC7|nr:MULTISPECIES: recombinase family protein [Asticcacaulis]
MRPTAAIYVRVSTARQAEHDLSLPDQIAQCQNWCVQKGWDVAEIFEEPGASALDDGRPVFQEMIFKACRSERPFNFVVVHSLSRFSRDALHSELYVRQLRKAGVELVSVTQDIGNDAGGELIRKVLNVFDEHQSRENAKHVHRSMLENTRQGFWNGSTPPYGYNTEVAERRGNKDKKILAINETEAPIVRQVFDLAAGVSGRPMGVKAIAVHLNDRGLIRRGYKFSTSSIYDILTSTTYYGVHYFNRRDSRTGILRPPSKWVALSVPAIIDEDRFHAVQGLLQSRNPKRLPPRFANGPTFLAGLARCGNCGAALIQNTGKGGRYRYYCCSKKLKEGGSSCTGLRMPMDRLDGIVLAELYDKILLPSRLQELLKAYLDTTATRDTQDREKLSRLRQDVKEAEAGLNRLLELVERGIMEADDPSLRDKLVGLRFRRNELNQDIADLQNSLKANTTEISPDKVERLAALLKDKLENGPPEIRQAYAKLIMTEVSVTKEEIRITGSKAMLAKGATVGLEKTPPPVLTFVRGWRTRRDSNS